MTLDQQKKIIQLVQNTVEEKSRCSIEKAAQEILYYQIPEAEKKRLEELITQSDEFLSEKVDGDWVILKNSNHKSNISRLDSRRKLSRLHYLLALIMSIAVAIVVKMFSPGKEETLIKNKSAQDLSSDTAFHWRWVGPKADSLNSVRDEP